MKAILTSTNLMAQHAACPKETKEELLDEAIEVLNDLENVLEECRKLWMQIENDNRGFGPVSEQNWQKKQAHCWIHGATELLETNEMERWLFDRPPSSPMSNTNARECVRNWREWLEIEDAYYEPFDDFEFEEPQQKETLGEFLIRMARLVEEEGKGVRLEWRALKCFLAYIRQFNQEAAFLEHIFPQKMDLQHGKIIRLINPEVYPLPVETACAILMELAKQCRNGRRDTRHTAVECLGFCWLCLAASRLRLPIRIEKIHATECSAIKLEGEFPILGVPTLFGVRNVQISGRVAKFIHLLSRIPSKVPRKTILTRCLRSLNRTFDELTKNIAPPEFGNITYVTLLSSPHDFGLRRFQP